MKQIVTERADVVDDAPTAEVAVVAAAPLDPASTEVLEDELVEDVSIDGMCGVY